MKRERSFGDFLLGAIACVTLLAFYIMMRDADAALDERRRVALERWVLPRKRRRRRTPEDWCRHCGGSGACDQCGDVTCRFCRGIGLQPRDLSLVAKLAAMWDGIS